MDLDRITASLENKSILITGSTGFLAKIFVEKILRVQPNVKQLFLVVRAQDPKSAQQRLNEEVLGKELFRVLKEKYGTNFNSFISSRVTPIAGDITCVDLGLMEYDLKKQLWDQLDIIVNIAATTNFYERYDVAIQINTLGAQHVMKFAMKCVRLQMLLHVSTAYVCGEKSGVILEKPFEMGETLNGVPCLDLEHELKLIQQERTELHARQATEKEEKDAMKELGMQRAKFYGWPNTYVFTKAMGEMLLGISNGILPYAIIRPSIITSTYKEPFPGWVEGIRTIDSLAVGYGKGELKYFVGDYNLAQDLIPGDMVVNAMITVMLKQTNRSNMFIYQVGSSVTNPVKSSTLRDIGFLYFSKNPWIDKEGKPIKVRKAFLFTDPSSFQRYMVLRYLFPLKVFQFVNATFFDYFQQSYTKTNRKVRFVLRLAEIYKPYIFFKGVFSESNLESLRSAMNKSEITTYYFDPKIIDWNDYLLNTHLPGLIRHVFKR